MRKSAVSGQFYPSKKAELEKAVKELIGKQNKNNKIKAAIVPHAGYTYSGKTAGKVFSLIPEKPCFLLLGVNHSGIGNKVSISFDDFETPLGIIKNNQELGEKILEKLNKEKIDADENEQAHKYEHSLEVELPFLQETQKEFSIVPIIFKSLSYEECKKIAGILSKLITNDIFILASSDFTHYGFSYGFTPFQNPKENLEKFDREVINEILKLNSEAFYKKASRSTVCGIYGLTILTEIAKLKAWKAHFVDYSTSAEVSGDWNNVVGYGGVVFES